MNRLILLLVTAPDCPVCQAYLDHTFSDGSVSELLGAFVPVHFTGKPKEESAAHLKVRGYPVVFFLEDSLEEKKRLVGYLPPMILINSLKPFIR